MPDPTGDLHGQLVGEVAPDALPVALQPQAGAAEQLPATLDAHRDPDPAGLGQPGIAAPQRDCRRVTGVSVGELGAEHPGQPHRGGGVVGVGQRRGAVVQDMPVRPQDLAFLGAGDDVPVRAEARPEAAVRPVLHQPQLSAGQPGGLDLTRVERREFDQRGEQRGDRHLAGHLRRLLPPPAAVDELLDQPAVLRPGGVQVLRDEHPDEAAAGGLARPQHHRRGLQSGQGVLVLPPPPGQVLVEVQAARRAQHLLGVGHPAGGSGQAGQAEPGVAGPGHVLTDAERGAVPGLDRAQVEVLGDVVLVAANLLERSERDILGEHHVKTDRPVAQVGHLPLPGVAVRDGVEPRGVAEFTELPGDRVSAAAGAAGRPGQRVGQDAVVLPQPQPQLAGPCLQLAGRVLQQAQVVDQQAGQCPGAGELHGRDGHRSSFSGPGRGAGRGPARSRERTAGRRCRAHRAARRAPPPCCAAVPSAADPAAGPGR